MKTILAYVFLLSLGASQVLAQASSWTAVTTPCQILDGSPDPTYSLGLGYVLDSKFRGYGSCDAFELEGALDLGYFHDVLLGDIDLGLDLDLMLLLGSARLQLPDQLVVLAVDVGWTWRYVDGYALQVRIAPGLYSDAESLSSRTFGMPFSVAGIKSFSPTLSGTVGLQMRPDFDRFFMPIFGLVWAPVEGVRVEATLPEARVLYHLDSRWSAHLGWAWESTTYSILEKGDYDREKLTLESYRTTVGVTHTLAHELRVTGEIGLLSKRDATFESTPVGMDDHISISEELFLRVGMSGSF